MAQGVLFGRHPKKNQKTLFKAVRQSFVSVLAYTQRAALPTHPDKAVGRFPPHPAGQADGEQRKGNEAEWTNSLFPFLFAQIVLSRAAFVVYTKNSKYYF